MKTAPLCVLSAVVVLGLIQPALGQSSARYETDPVRIGVEDIRTVTSTSTGTSTFTVIEGTPRQVPVKATLNARYSLDSEAQCIADLEIVSENSARQSYVAGDVLAPIEDIKAYCKQIFPPVIATVTATNTSTATSTGTGTNTSTSNGPKCAFKEADHYACDSFMTGKNDIYEKVLWTVWDGAPASSLEADKAACLAECEKEHKRYHDDVSYCTYVVQDWSNTGAHPPRPGKCSWVSENFCDMRADSKLFSVSQQFHIQGGGFGAATFGGQSASNGECR